MKNGKKSVFMINVIVSNVFEIFCSLLSMKNIIQVPMLCKNSEFVPFHLSEKSAVKTRRGLVGLGPVIKYIVFFCQKETLFCFMNHVSNISCYRVIVLLENLLATVQKTLLANVQKTLHLHAPSNSLAATEYQNIT